MTRGIKGFQKGNHPKTEFKKGQHFSEKHRKNIGKARLGKPSGMKDRKKENGNFPEQCGFRIGNHPKSEFKKGEPLPKEVIIKRIETRKKNGWFKNPEETKKKIKAARAKQILPLKDTKIELKIQNFLKQLGIPFFTHKYIKIKHGYRCDILIPSMNMVIEADGDYWHGNPTLYPNPNNWQQEHINRDRIRTIELIAKGFKVLRLWGCNIDKMDLDDFKDRLNWLI